MYKIVLLRHGESVWNKENRFTGWTDVDLTEKGVQEGIDAGTTLIKEGFSFDQAFTSVLLRASLIRGIIVSLLYLLIKPWVFTSPPVKLRVELSRALTKNPCLQQDDDTQEPPGRRQYPY